MEQPNYGRAVRDSKGRFVTGNQTGAWALQGEAIRIRKLLCEIADDDLVRETMIKCLNSEKDRLGALTLMLHYVAGKPTERIEVSGGQGQTLFNIEILSIEDRQALESITLKSLTPNETVKIIDAEFEQTKPISSSDLKIE